MIRRDSGTMELPASAARRRPPGGLDLPQSQGHRRLQSTLRMRMDRGMDRLVADAGSRVVGVPSPVVLEPMANHRLDPEPARDLFR